jgi:uncharacterized integral membrane protein
MEEIIKIAKSLPELVKLLETMVSSTLGAITLAAVLFGYLLTKIPQLALIQSMQKKKEEQKKMLEEYLANPSSDASCVAVLKDQRDGRMFEVATGINAGKKWRDGLVDLQNRKDITWLEMRRAWRYMELVGSEVKIRSFTKWDKAEERYNYFMAFVFVIMATFTFILASIQQPSLYVLLAFLVSGVLIALAVWAIAQTLPIRAARKIESKAASAASNTSGNPAAAVPPVVHPVVPPVVHPVVPPVVPSVAAPVPPTPTPTPTPNPTPTPTPP